MKLLRIIAIICIITTLCACTPAAQNPTETTLPRESLPEETAPKDVTKYVVENPMEYPDYTFTDKPSTNTLRLTVVQAMKDLLSVQWSTDHDIVYNKTGPVDHKTFQHMADTTYAGTPYSNGATGIFQFFEYYDQKTGRFWYPGTATELGRNLGNSCADSLIWAYDTVCTSIKGGYYPNVMTYKNGYLPVGDYTYDFSINSYTKLPTKNIVEQNSKSVMMNSYAKVLPGDALVSSTENHAMMAIAAAHLVHKSDGTLDTAESYIMIQDQRGGVGKGFFEVEENGKIIRYSGRTSFKITFDELYKKHYIPVTPAELLGMRTYQSAEVTSTKESCSTLEELQGVTVSSNYPLAVLNVIVSDSFGNQKVIEKKLFSGVRNGPPKEFELKDLKSLGTYIADGNPVGGCTVSIEIVVSTGERFIPVKLIF